LHKGVAPYISYSESFEPIVSGTDVDGQPFKPKRGKQVETGIKYVPESGNVSANAAVYRLTETNRVSPNPTNPNLPGVQRGEVTVEGVELEAVLNLSAWDVSANYTYTNAKQTASSSPANDATLGKKLVSVPTHSASLWAVSNFGIGDVAGFRAGLGVRYVGETWDGTDTLSTPSNTLLDALLAFNAGPWGIALNASNLADKDYIATCLDRGDCWFGSRREIVGTVSFRF
jgi:iron complex outermembrane receptor protein